MLEKKNRNLTSQYYYFRDFYLYLHEGLKEYNTKMYHLALRFFFEAHQITKMDKLVPVPNIPNVESIMRVTIVCLVEKSLKELTINIQTNIEYIKEALYFINLIFSNEWESNWKTRLCCLTMEKVMDVSQTDPNVNSLHEMMQYWTDNTEQVPIAHYQVTKPEVCEESWIIDITKEYEKFRHGEEFASFASEHLDLITALPPTLHYHFPSLMQTVEVEDITLTSSDHVHEQSMEIDT